MFKTTFALSLHLNHVPLINFNKTRLISLKYRKIQNKFPIGPLIQPIWLNSNPVYIYDNPNLQKNSIGSQNRKKGIIYQWVNLLNGKTYIGSSITGSNRLASYWRPCILKRNLPIFKSITFYGIHNFGLAVLEDLGDSNLVNKELLLEREQFYLNLLFKTFFNTHRNNNLVLNLSKIAESTTDFKHTEDFKLKGTGKLNPMYNKPKYEALIKMQKRDKRGIKNNKFNKKESKIYFDSLIKLIYVYKLDENNNKIFLGSFSTVKCYQSFNMGSDTLKKYLYNKQVYKGKFFSLSKIK